VPPRLSGPKTHITPTLGYSRLDAAIDTDGDPNERGFDEHWSATTSLPGLNSAVNPYVTFTQYDADAGVGIGDWR
jgi:hypothetical protein